MAYACDFSGDHAHVDGVETATYTTPDGATTASAVKLRRGSLTYADITAGQVFGVTPGDVPFVLWRATLESLTPAQGGTVTVGGVSYTVLVVLQRADNAQFRVIARRHV